MTHTWTRKDFITTEGLSRPEIETIFGLATAFKRTLGRARKTLPSLRGKTVVNLFLEPSTRTRVAFEMAAKRLGADVISIAGDSSSLTKGETLRDTICNIRALNADLIVIRHKSSGAPLYLSRILDIPVINAGDGAHEHPTQAMLDCYTLRERLGDLTGKKSPSWATSSPPVWPVPTSTPSRPWVPP